MPFLTVTRFRPRLLGSAAAALVLVFGLGVAGCGSSTQTAVESTVEDTLAGASLPGFSTSTGHGLFDASMVHEIAVSFAQADYDAMIEAYKTAGEKEWIEATVTIDGAVFRDAGLRLKGNSSIMMLRDDQPAGGPGGNTSAEHPEGLPWLIRLDKYNEGQNYEGIVDLVVRSNTSATCLNEAVALDLLQLAGLPSQEAIAVRFSVNGSEAILRLVTEHPDDVWMTDNLDASGALYKAESTGDYSYRGSDPASYEDVFDQEAGRDNADLTPLVEFLDFINNSDDVTFCSELPERLDIEAFATYLAMEELIDNFDDIDGPGNNSYLYYEPDAGVFTVVPWDHNLAFGGVAGANGFGAPADVGPETRGMAPGGRKNVADGTADGMTDGMAEGMTGGRRGGMAEEPAGEEAGRAAGWGKSNVLVERFRDNPEFEALYQEKLAEMTADLYESGAAIEVLTQWVSLLKTQASDLVGSTTVDAEAAKIAQYFTE